MSGEAHSFALPLSQHVFAFGSLQSTRISRQRLPQILN
jgi:hypothetical protein